MAMKNVFIYFNILLITAYSASAAAEATLDRWVLNVTLHDDGVVEETIQAELANSGTSPLEGFSFVVPASSVTMIYDFDHTQSFIGQVVEQQAVPGGIKLTINFNSSIEPGSKWDGRIGFTATKWAVKQDSDYSIDIPIKAPQAIVSGKTTDVVIPADADVRSQVFLPKAVEVTSVNPKPYRILFQYDQMVPTWSSDNLHIGDTISLKGSFSDVLNKIVGTDERLRNLSLRIKEAKAQGIDVLDAEAHLKNAEDYNTNQALQSFWEANNTAALEYNGYANNELNSAESSLSVKKEIQRETPSATESTKTPDFEAPAMAAIMLIAFLVLRRRN